MAQKRLSQAELIEDFKQYVAVTVTNVVTGAVQESETRIKSVLKSEFRIEIGKLRSDMNDGFAGIADILENHQGQLDKHERAIKKLQTKVA